uniref:RNA-dependent RNA polymerase n=1 Tax=Zhangzhou Parti tick virus 2 TaxID=2972268 RepID=A0A9E7V237_9VIRU|nr:MAG: RNA-dependent RNA polymerase [Zhangzhou Parti tick virus 2]
MLLSEIPNIYARALALERRVRLSALYPEGIIPYLKRQEYAGSIATPIGPAASVAPPVTTSFIAKLPLEKYPNRAYTLECQNSMLDLGRMDPYAFSSSIPKFDPWFRHLLKSKDPDYSKHLEETYMRDPCTPDRVMKHIALFDRWWKRKPTGKAMKQAEECVKRMFAHVKQVDPIDFNFEGWHKIIPHLDMTSSPGLPLRREYPTQGECLGHIYDKSKRLNHFAKFLHPAKVRAPPCMIGLRPGLIKREDLDTKLKARGVWAYPAEVKVIEMRYVIPLLARMTEHFGSVPYPIGRNMTKCLPMIIDNWLKDKRFGVVTDISKLDTCIGPDYIDWAFDFTKKLFFMGMTTSSDTRNSNVFDFLHYYFKRTPILLPSGQLIRKSGGVPSGSGFTQWIDTLVTLLISSYACIRSGYSVDQIVDDFSMACVGDDWGASVPPSFDVEEFAHYISQLGFIVNVDKVMFSNKGIELKFLGYSKYGGGIFRSLDELLQTAYFPEKFVGSPERSRQRILGQTIASGLCNGAFSKFNYWAEELVGYVSTLDPDDVFIPQRRWMRNVLQLDEMPKTSLVYDLYHLV